MRTKSIHLGDAVRPYYRRWNDRNIVFNLSTFFSQIRWMESLLCAFDKLYNINKLFNWMWFWLWPTLDRLFYFSHSLLAGCLCARFKFKSKSAMWNRVGAHTQFIWLNWQKQYAAGGCCYGKLNVLHLTWSLFRFWNSIFLI